MSVPLTATTRAAFVAMGLLLVAGCVGVGAPPARRGMVKDPATGLQMGSNIEKNFVTEASFYSNKRIKVRTRNTSGDPAFDLSSLRGLMEESYRDKGYDPTTKDDFGLLIDVNVMYSGQVQTHLAKQFTFLGAAAGGITGYRAGGAMGTAIGTIAGATLGNIAGSFVTDDTYIIVARVTFGVVRKGSKPPKKRITFTRSERAGDEEDEDRGRGFRRTFTTRVAVFAGGRNTPQWRIAAAVRQRFARIVGDVI